MNINQAFPSKFLKASDLAGNAVNVKISGVKVESVGQGQENKPVVYFSGKQKGMVLNKTNAGKIANIAGSQDTDEWTGITVQIYPTETEFAGETVECIRVRPPKAAPKKVETDFPDPDQVNEESEPFSAMRTRLIDLETCGLPEAKDWVEPISAPSNYKDPVKIAAYIAEAEAERAERFSLDPDLCRIVALGFHDVNEGDPTVYRCSNDFEEREQLKLFWDSYSQRETRLISFYGFRFDLPVLVMRSLYLNVKHPVLTFMPAWKAYPHVDLWETLSLNGARRDVKSLRFYAKRFGIPIYDDISGKDVAACVAAGDWDAVENHALYDLTLTRALAERLGVLKPAQVLA